MTKYVKKCKKCHRNPCGCRRGHGHGHGHGHGGNGNGGQTLPPIS